MAEKLKFGELDIDIEKLVKSSAKSLRHLQGLEDRQKALKKSSKDLRVRIDEIRRSLDSPEIEKNSAEYVKLQQTLKNTHNQYSNITESFSFSGLVVVFFSGANNVIFSPPTINFAVVTVT